MYPSFSSLSHLMKVDELLVLLPLFEIQIHHLPFPNPNTYLTSHSIVENVFERLTWFLQGMLGSHILDEDMERRYDTDPFQEMHKVDCHFEEWDRRHVKLYNHSQLILFLGSRHLVETLDWTGIHRPKLKSIIDN